jgi:Family of unknown function (DUF6498)
MLNLIRRLLLALGVNAVPAAGLALAGWGSATALASYWAENLIGVLLVAARIALHRRMTHKAGHYLAQIDPKLPRAARARTSFLVEFLVTGLVFTLAHGLFIGLFSLVTENEIDPTALRNGLIGIAVMQLTGFGLDALTLSSRPFAWMKQMALFTLSRVTLVHLALIAGVGLAALSGVDQVFVLPFVVLKTVVDVLGVLRLDAQEHETAPGWMVSLVNKLKPDGDFAAYYASARAAELAAAAHDEATTSPPPPTARRNKNR